MILKPWNFIIPLCGCSYRSHFGRISILRYRWRAVGILRIVRWTRMNRLSTISCWIDHIWARITTGILTNGGSGGWSFWLGSCGWLGCVSDLTPFHAIVGIWQWPVTHLLFHHIFWMAIRLWFALPIGRQFSLERNSSRLAVAAIYQPPIESLMGHVIGSQTDQMLHRNAIDQQMMAILHEQQFRSPMPIQLALANFIGANEADYTARNHNSSLLQSLIHSRLQQQQQQLQAALMQHQLNSAIFHQPQLHVQPHQPYFNDPLSVTFTQSQQHSGTIDALFSQLSPSVTANVLSTSLDNELVRSSFDSSRMMSVLAGPTNTFHSGRNITSSASMSRDLLHQLCQRSNDSEMDQIPKSDSDANSDDQKPPARGL